MRESRPDRFNTHAAPPLQAEGVPPEEDVSQAQASDQVDQDPDEVPNAHKPEQAAEARGEK